MRKGTIGGRGGAGAGGSSAFITNINKKKNTTPTTTTTPGIVTKSQVQRLLVRYNGPELEENTMDYDGMETIATLQQRQQQVEYVFESKLVLYPPPPKNNNTQHKDSHYVVVFIVAEAASKAKQSLHQAKKPYGTLQYSTTTTATIATGRA